MYVVRVWEISYECTRLNVSKTELLAENLPDSLMNLSKSVKNIFEVLDFQDWGPKTVVSSRRSSFTFSNEVSCRLDPVSAQGAVGGIFRSDGAKVFVEHVVPSENLNQTTKRMAI
jgi:hypothetical protein